MKFSVSKTNILKALRLIAGAVERKFTGSPVLSNVLSNVLLELKGNILSLTTTDQEVELVHEIELGCVYQEGSTTVSFKKFLDICKVASEKENIDVLSEGNKVIIKSGKSKFILSSLPSDKFPKVNGFDVNFSIDISQEKIKELFEKTSFAVAEQDVRYYLNGMLLHIYGNKMSSVATDGHRLAVSSIDLPIPVSNENNIKILLPRKGVLEVLRILKQDKEKIKLIFSSTHLCVKSRDITITTMLLEGKFPEYERVLLSSGSMEVVGSRNTLKESFQRAAALLNEKFKGVQLKLSNCKMIISATNSEKDEVEEELDVNYNGSDLEIGFNVKYLLDFVNVIKSDKLKFVFSGPEESVTVQGVDEDNTKYVLMPMKI